VTRRRVAVLISGRGSNMAALLEAAAEPSYPAEVVLVLSNRADAAGLHLAAEAGIATQVIDHRDFADRATFDAALDRSLRAAQVELVCLAGFMRLLTAGFVGRWRDRILNIHPSLLPAFKGINVHERVLEAGVRISGCTVHVVRAEADAGPIIAQAAVPVLGNDTAESLAARVLAAEHRLYPFALGAVAAGRVRVVGDHARFVGRSSADGILFSPTFAKC
jgi:phosphoribosylglycinamide formyltransferase-1